MPAGFAEKGASEPDSNPFASAKHRHGVTEGDADGVAVCDELGVSVLLELGVPVWLALAVSL